MTLDLPQPIADYFKADLVDDNAVAQCFTENAVVQDEGHTYHGRAAIKNWKADTAAKFQYTTELLALERQAEKSVVTCRLEGNFPGSPVSLRFCFELAGDKIASLEVIP
jgi:hypothetical protein